MIKQKNEYYLESQRNYLDDYSNTVSKEIDMTLSGKYIANYPEISLDLNELDKYPIHSFQIDLENRIKDKYKIKENVVIGTGTNGILQNLVKIAFVERGNLVTPYYSFNQAEYAVTSFKGVTRRVYTKEKQIDFSNIFSSIDENTKMVYICNPNNPTGIFINSKILLENIKKINSKILVVIDESSIEFTGKESLLNYELPENVIVLRTFSKAYGLANLRVGYMVCSDKVYEKYKENITINEVSGMSCQIVLKVIDSDNYKENVKKVVEEREKIIKELNNLGIETYNSNSNIILTKNEFDEGYLKELEEKEVSVVSVENRNGKKHIRIAVQDNITNDKFIQALKELVRSRIK